MNTLERNVTAFISLGLKIREEKNNWEQWASEAQQYNQWFTPAFVKEALEAIADMLEGDKMKRWVADYQLPEVQKNVGVIMAGNIPLVGFHDFLCVLLSGHHISVKPSSSDPVLIRKIVKMLIEIDPLFEFKIHFPEKLNNIDALIATGSDNSAKYFNYYFSKIPHIIRKNRISVGIIDGSESPADFKRLGEDIFKYYGLGCRNVSKLYIHEKADISLFFEGVEAFSYVKNNNKYYNNYEYHKAIYLINAVEHLDNGFVLLTPSPEPASPVGVLYYQRYTTSEELQLLLDEHRNKIQIVVSKEGEVCKSLPFGQAQRPAPWDYADNIDTLQFLSNL